MTEIPEAVGRPCIIEWHGERREVGTIERATHNEDGSITVELEMHNGFAHYIAAPTQHIDYREGNLEAIREQIDNPLRIGKEQA